ncbi:MAG TPA: SCO family protein [Gammaproteobacteria bacterium]|mgnify:CR=1 FL=1|nr:SCO family protein [Gammaproteobacteria bacterium]|tara:strand:- start:50 stop:700 length:651 start_codon:yes stop_codon:yes gene_type:complete
MRILLPVHIKLIISAVILCTIFSSGIYIASRGHNESAHSIPGILWPDPPSIGSFSLTNSNGDAVTERNLQGRWTLIFFGFTSCPDICPTTLATLSQVYQRLQSNQYGFEKIQVLFVSVDPARDDGEKLQAYVDYFNRDFIGATADEERIKQLTDQFGVVYFKVKTTGPANYNMNHTSSVLLVDPHLRFVGIFSQPHEAGDITERLVQIISFVEDAG